LSNHRWCWCVFLYENRRDEKLSTSIIVLPKVACDTYIHPTQSNPSVHRFGPSTTATAPPPTLLHYSSSTSSPPIPIGQIFFLKKRRLKSKEQRNNNNTEDLVCTPSSSPSPPCEPLCRVLPSVVDQNLTTLAARTTGFSRAMASRAAPL
jgi:hypothetical protein